MKKDPVFLEALYLLSPKQYDKISNSFSQKKIFPLKNFRSSNKHYRRSGRCTPLGLFSGVGLGWFNKLSTTIAVPEKIRDQIDMHFLAFCS
ncbi:hypothetical protein EG349_09165 [Chryseobacterium shandongense]|uniref:Lantibiotic dehydratase N-terminal domain-containing protein n=1 Tax=Chryseobacterium shandongense TaxID=1493872 RepID=A0AAD0YEG4_9FLAO|nr:hypothetical protein EG349_09165 [Chryseobacterium shandongense]AZA95364.1 hypothetical protein EG353_07240 [Chryseobacterium shandongense]